MKINLKKIIIIFVGMGMIYGALYWHVADTKKRASVTKTTSFLINDQAKDDYRERISYIIDVYYSMINEMEERNAEERKERMEEVRKIAVDEGYIGEEDEEKMTDEEIIILLEKVLMKTKNETE